MPQSIKQRSPYVPDRLTEEAIRSLFVSVLTDLTALRTLLNTHVHSGVTAGGANTGAPTTTAAALDLQA